MNRTSHARSALFILSLLVAVPGCGAPAPKTTAPTAQVTETPPPIAAVAEAPIGADHVASPIRVTDSGGAELRVTAVHASTVIEDPVAKTELQVLVENPLETAADARLLVTLPRRARAGGVSVTRGAETTQLGSRTADVSSLSFEDWSAVATDPRPLTARDDGAVDALLPTLKAGERALVTITYIEVLSGDPLVVKLRGLPALDVLDVRVAAAGAEKPIAEVALAGARPDADLVVPAANYRTGGVEAHGLVSGDLVAIRAVLPDRLADADPLVAPIFMIDTSATSALELGRYLTSLRALVKSLPAELPIQIAAFDQVVEPLFDGRAGDFGETVESAIRARHALGAADLEKALRWAAHEASASKGERRLVLFTSGHTAAGEVGGVAQAVKALRESGIARRDAIAPRVGRDAGRLDLVVHGDDGRGAVFDDDLDVDVLSRRLQRKSLGAVPISIAGASDVFPHDVEDGRAGDAVMVVARVPNASGTVKVTLGVTRVDVPLVAATAPAGLEPFLESPKVALFGPAGGGAPRAVLADAVAGGRYRISNVASTLSVDAMSTDPMNGTVASATTPMPIEEPTPEVAVEEPVAEPKEPADQPTIPPGRIPAETIRRIVRINSGRFKSCYIDLLRRKPHTSGRVVTSFRIAADGTVADAAVVDASSDIHDSETSYCVTTAFSKLSFPSPGAESVTIVYPLRLTTEKSADGPTGSRVQPGHATPRAPERGAPDEHLDPLYRGRLLGVMSQIDAGDAQGALHEAWTWVNEAPSEPLGYFALGQSARATGDGFTAERAFGSILALWPDRPDMARFAGQQLEQLQSDASLELAIDAYERAVEARPDEPTAYRLLAFARLRAGHPEAAFKTIQRAMEANYGNDRFVGARATLTSDLSTLAAAWLHAHPNQRKEIENGLKSSGAAIETKPNLRFVVVWEQPSKASLVVRDASANPEHLAELKTTQAHVTGALGPDELTIRGTDRHPPFSFVLQMDKANGPMGFTMGKLEVVDHDGSGNVTFAERPFLVMNGATRIDLGAFTGK